MERLRRPLSRVRRSGGYTSGLRLQDGLDRPWGGDGVCVTVDDLPGLTSVVETQPRRREIHIIVDNLSAHKTQKVRTFLVAHPNVRLHYTPTYSSWLNQVELWFSKIERDVIARGVFTSVTDLRRKLMRYIKQYNKTAKPVRWA
jgi:transposase